MPTNGQAIIRQMVIDRYLSSGRGYTMKQPYIKTKPLHDTQRIVEETPEGATISIDVILNYELEQLILSYGEAVKVLSPVSFRDKMKQSVEKLMENYK